MADGAERMKNLAAYIGLAVTLVTLLVGAAIGYQNLKDRVDALEKREHYEHGSYALPEGAR